MRIKDAVALVNEKTDSMDKRYVALENIVSWDGTFVETSATTEGTNSVFQSGDVLFGKLRPYLAKGFIPDFDGICSTEFFVMRPRKQILNKFLLYYFLSPHFIDDIKHKVAGVKMPRTDWGTFGAMEIAPPPLPEQRRIVAYLDEKTEAIDKRVELLEKKKEAVTRLKKSIINRAVTRGLDPNAKLKDSGVDWIGQVPERWRVRRGKDILAVLSGFPADSEKFEINGDGIPLVRIRDISNDCTEVSYSGEYPTQYIVHPGDLLIGMDGDFNIAKWRGPTALLNQRVCKISPRTGMRLDYLFYLFPFPLVDLNSRKVLTTVRHLGVFDINEMFFPIPPVAEQDALVAFLDAECAKIDAAVANLDKQIDAYRRLKRSLIDEVVTGKRKVG